MHPFRGLVREAIPHGFPLAITLASLVVLLLGTALWIGTAAGLLAGAGRGELMRISAFTMPMAAAGFLVAGLQERRDPARVLLLGGASLLLIASGALVGAVRAPGGSGAVLGGICWGIAPAVLVAAFALPAAIRIRMRLSGERPEGPKQPPGRGTHGGL